MAGAQIRVAGRTFTPGRALAVCLLGGALDLAVLDLGVGPLALVAPTPAGPEVHTTAAVAPARAPSPPTPLPKREAAAPPAGAILYFPTDGVALDDAARAQLDELVARAGGATVVVDGHADPRGSDPHNQALSARRAAAVAEALRARGFTVKGTFAYGAARPATAGDDREAWRLDRRVEVRVAGGGS